MNGFQKSLGVGSLIIASSIAYYFVIVLPEAEKQRIAIDKERLQLLNEKNQKEEILLREKAAKEEERYFKLLDCRVAVENERNQYLEMNGIPMGNGEFRASNRITARLAQIEKDGNADCDRMYGGK